VKNVAVAMGPSSRLIIADMIMLEKIGEGTEVTPYWMDFNYKLQQPDDTSSACELIAFSVVMILNGAEKSKKEFEEILGSAGLEIVKIWPFTFGTHTNIECRLKALK
jgi:hypothetical protein